MDIKKWKEKTALFSQKYRYVLIVLLIGLILMLIPGKNSNNPSDSEIAKADTSLENSLEMKLSALLSKVEGAGRVEVILTISEGEEIVYQTNGNATDSSVTGSTNTVTVTDANRNQTGLIKQIKAEKYQGAIIVCAGANNPSVRLQIVDAVSRATGLGVNKISVLKMK